MPHFNKPSSSHSSSTSNSKRMSYANNNSGNSSNYSLSHSSTNSQEPNYNGYSQYSNFEAQFGNNSMHNACDSKLQPTAQEFYPASFNLSVSNSGAEPSTMFQEDKRSGRNARYGSGRLANSNTSQSNYDYEQLGYLEQRDSNIPKTSNSDVPFSNDSSSSSGNKSQHSRTKNGYYSKAYSKNRYENRTNYRRIDFDRGESLRNGENFSQNGDYLSNPYENQSSSSRSFDNVKNTSQIKDTSFSRFRNHDKIESTSKNSLYNKQGSSKKNGRVENYHQNDDNTPHGERYDKNRYSGKGKSTYSHSRDLVNELKEETNGHYDNKNKNGIKCNFNYERNNFEYDSFPSSMRNQGNNSQSRKSKGKFYESESNKRYDDNSYKIREDNSFKNRDNCESYSGTSSNYRNNKGKSLGNWRNKPKYVSEKSNSKTIAAGQRERLIDMIDRRTLECLVCCEKIKTNDKVWSCMQCYHILHLSCISAWAKSSKIDENWRCPACQNICSELPGKYNCFCGKVADPKFDPNVIAHGCGEMCLRKGRHCDHKCTILCHPGPCPDCNIMVSKPCGCGATSQTVKCSTELEIVCDSICNKMLECGIHQCAEKCHTGACAPCSEVIIQECFCGKTGRKVPCDAEHSGQSEFCCENPCQKVLSCGNHTCEKPCHPGDCGPCSRDVSVIGSCYCGKMPLKIERLSCLDPIPCCDKVCGKLLACGQPSNPHSCQEKCHEGKCPPCPLTTVVRCRCGHMDKEMACQKLTTKADDARCEKKCNKKRLCGKHKCNQRCCIEMEHFCPLPCNHLLSCGLHRCERTCHSGRCAPCLESSFEELHCECGASVIYPPVPCGTKPPSCREPCSRMRPCGHPPNHECHSGPCPPCFVLTKRWCFGHHEQRAAIPCHQENFSCGLPCGKAMPCGRHKCVKPCHEGDCPTPCNQPCTVPRVLCGHPCGKPCHESPCPESYCKQMVPISCLCGLLKSTRPCTEVADEFRNLEMAQLKEKMESMSMPDQAVDISDIVTRNKRPAVLKIMECNDDCKILERNRRLAIGLQIRNPDLSQKLTPRYSDFMKQWAKKDPIFCQKVHDKLTELVQLAKQSKQKSRSHSFESMNRDKRHFIHEYAEHFGCESAAYDQEPNRNVVATAVKEKSWLPSMSLLEVLQRENGQRKVPGPILASGSSTKSESVSMKLISRAQKPTEEKVAESVVRNPWVNKPAFDSEENDRYFSNP